ncbi:hypothetical protein LSTR_LSTR007875 [Laodelphax striatellus]|uniref:Ig-like domain-containing protein n=1 Tax=Laodelphax striatellus TaxID=195883 RepID=A0A482XR03_LAOST|nr:hypothetical protein LSTR_LSTR007875 [Laodelphax striatellus]
MIHIRKIILICLLFMTSVNSAVSTESSSEDDEPEFMRPVGNVTVPVGKEAILTCAVDDLKGHNLGWVRLSDNTVLTLHGKLLMTNSRFFLTHDNRHLWKLHIRQSMESDRDCYMCQINTKIMKSSIGCLDVLVPPDIKNEGTSSDTEVAEGANVTLRCNASGVPKPKVTWKREDGAHIKLKGRPDTDSVVGDQIDLVNVHRSQMGSYMCIASNEVPPAVSKRISLNVEFESKMTIGNKQVGSVLGGTVVLTCQAEMYPVNYIVWTLNDQHPPLSQGGRHTIQEWRDSYMWHMKLTITDVAKEDYGYYRCTAYSSREILAGDTIRLYEIIPVTTTPPSTTSTTTQRLTTIRPRKPRTTTTTSTQKTPEQFQDSQTIFPYLELPREGVIYIENGVKKDGAINNPSSGRRSDVILNSSTATAQSAVREAAQLFLLAVFWLVMIMSGAQL